MKTMGEKYDRIGRHYNQTRCADPYLTDRLLEHLSPNGESLYLDIGCGTGNYSIALRERGVNIVGVDPSNEMLNKARARSYSIEWKNGRADNLPIGCEEVDGAFATLTIHHWSDIPSAFMEVGRVLNRESRFVIFTSTPDQMSGYWLNQYFPKMLEASSMQMPSYEAVKSALEASGFEICETEKYFVREDLEDHFLYSGKQRPILYMEEEFRQGISSFSLLSTQEEIERGLSELSEDITSGRIEKIVKDFENDRGDYLFIVGQKVLR